MITRHRTPAIRIFLITGLAGWLLASPELVALTDDHRPTSKTSVGKTFKELGDTLPVVTVTTEDQLLRGFKLRTSSDVKDIRLLVPGIGITEVAEDLEPVVEELRQATTDEIDPALLVKGCVHEDAVTRDHCHRLLELKGDLPSNLLSVGLGHENEEMRWRSLKLLQVHPDATLRRQIGRCLKDKEVRVRVAAVKAYAKIRPSDFWWEMESAFAFDKNPRVQNEALLQLGKADSHQAVDIILRHLETLKDECLTRTAFRALRQVTGHNFPEVERLWQNWWLNNREAILAAEEAKEERWEDELRDEDESADEEDGKEQKETVEDDGNEESGDEDQ